MNAISWIFCAAALLAGSHAHAADRARVTRIETRPGRPPLATYLYDVELTNDAATARWFLLPTWIETARPKTAGVTGVDVEKDGAVRIGHFQGTGGFHAVLVPAHGTVALHALPVKSMEGTPKNLPVTVASRLQIGADAAEIWMRGESRRTPDLSELPVVMTVDATLVAE